MIGLFAAAALAAASAPPMSESDGAAVIAYYGDMARAMWIGPCATVVPREADRFRAAYEAWHAANAALIARGESVLREVPAGASDADGDARPDSFVTILREMPAPDALAWCERQFGLRGYDDAAN